jgi:outer membrane protein assembly factor BamB
MSFGLSAPTQADDKLWTLAEGAYGLEQYETGHLHLKQLTEKNPGDMELALKCLERIMAEASRQNPIAVPLARWKNRLTYLDNHWAVYAARRICALERIGAVSANRSTVHDAFEVMLRSNLRAGRLLETVEIIDRFVEQNPHDPFWRISQANFYRALDSAKTRPLFDKLKAEMDLDHPDALARERWTEFSLELESDREKLPRIIQPVPVGSPLPLMDPDDPDGEWDIVASRSARTIAIQIDRLAGKTLVTGSVVLWKDRSGLTDPVRALDLHLLSQPKADVEPLRKLQTERFSQENIRPTATAEETLALFRRYAWALPAQQRLLASANRQLWAGRAQSALRSFQDLLNHATDRMVRDAAQVGYWTARAQINPPMQLDEMLDGVDPNRSLTWLGKPAKASEICKQLLASGKPLLSRPAEALKDLRQRVIHIPPVSPWSTNLPSTVDLVVAGQELLVSGRDVLVSYNASNLIQPTWSNSQRHHAEENRRGGYYPGYFRPQFDGDVFYTRFGFSSVPCGIAAFDRATGQPLWSSERPRFDAKRRLQFNIPLGDPVLSDGLLYYLQWNTQGDVNQSRGRRLSIACFDPERRQPVWESTIAEAGHRTDASASLERAQPLSAIYGNRVTIHEGAIYSNSNSGIVARSDVRDGRTDWIHYYRPDSRGRSVLNLGSPPIIAGDNVIFMPRNANRIFALDQHTGRLVWENLLVMGVELVGTVDDLLIVRGQSTVAGLDLATGAARWYRPMNPPVMGRTHLSAASVYVAQLDKLLRLDAKTGHVLEERPWGLANERPQNFTIHGRDLYVVTDKPAKDAGRTVGRPLNPSMPSKATSLTLPLARAWSLPRDNAKVTMAPKDSPLHGSAYVISQGIIERIDVSARGAIRWQRFINTFDPHIHFVGKTMLVVDHVNGRAAGVMNRVIAYDATDGRTLWEHALDSAVHETLNCGATQIFHDSNSRIVAIDLASGRRVWERELGSRALMKVSWNAGRLDVFTVSRFRSAHHLQLAADSGQTLRESVVEPQVGKSKAQNGQLGEDGYYQVTVPTVRARYVRLVALSEVNGGGWTSIAELQVIGSDGKDLNRDAWKVHKVDSFESNAPNRNATPENVFDNDRTSWWHTPWIGGILRHPHDIQIDLGAEQNVAGIRYLPAVIINNNGMIQDYELYVSKDGKNWGSFVAKGFLVSRLRVDRAYATGRAILFETSERWPKPRRIFRYSLDGKSAPFVREDGQIVFVKEPYYVITAKNDKKEDTLFVHRLDNDAYRFELGPTKLFDAKLFEISGDRLVLGRRGVVVADLAKKRFIVAPSDSKLKHNQMGLIVRNGPDSLLKIVSQGNQGQMIFRFDLRTGKQTESTLTSQTEAFSDRQPQNQIGGIQQFDGVLLLNDSSSISAWIGQ